MYATLPACSIIYRISNAVDSWQNKKDLLYFFKILTYETYVLEQKLSVRNLEFGQHGNSLSQSLVDFLSVAVGVLLQPGEAEALVAPVLSEVAVHRIVLEEGRGDPLFICGSRRVQGGPIGFRSGNGCVPK